MEASNAATQTTPGAMVRSMLISGPTPRGNRLTTMTKKNNVVRTSDRRRIASKRSRWVMRTNMSGELQPLDGRSRYLNLLMGGHYDHAALYQVSFHYTLHQFHRGGIKRRQWLIQ